MVATLETLSELFLEFPSKKERASRTEAIAQSTAAQRTQPYKKHYGIVNYYTVVFVTTPPQMYYAVSASLRGNVCNSQENGVRTLCAAIVNHYALVNFLRRANFKFLRRSLFSTAGSFGWDFLEEIPENSGKTPRNALRAFPGSPLGSTAGIPQAR